MTLKECSTIYRDNKEASLKVLEEIKKTLDNLNEIDEYHLSACLLVNECEKEIKENKKFF